MNFFVTTASVLTAVLIVACSSGPEPVATKGQEIQDLQNAYQNRAITPEEYKDQKEEVLDR